MPTAAAMQTIVTMRPAAIACIVCRLPRSAAHRPCDAAQWLMCEAKSSMSLLTKSKGSAGMRAGAWTIPAEEASVCDEDMTTVPIKDVNDRAKGAN